MGLLLYKSNEMFSATELIRKSKMIFDKVVNDEIEKAIILRDGKPGFLLMDFVKYEKIMAEYEELKALGDEQKEQDNQIKFDKKQKNKKAKKTKDIEIIENQENQIIEKINIDDSKNKENKIIEVENSIAKDEIKEIEEVSKKPAFVVPPRPKMENNIIKEESDLDKIEDNFEDNSIDTKQKQNDIDDNDELKKALESLRSMNLDDDMRVIAEEQIKQKLKLAREERARVLELEQENEREDLKEELELQVHIKEENKKKERELKEFWD
ncbi:MAG: hypothetical protein U9O56_03845 [Campylobacterota bacterium]|nr:hypothetical protein [Campylobacterota bacterium]